jgi:gentisate 1,2-dioxygenase
MTPSTSALPIAVEESIPTATETYAKAKGKLETAIRAKDLVPLWNTGAPPSGREPGTKFIPASWKYEDTKNLLLEAGKVVDARESERRALLMINPGPRRSPHTVDTLLVAHQMILPGEQALCHRHTPFAVRFLIEGEQGMFSTFHLVQESV